MTERENQVHNDNEPAHSTVFMFLFSKHNNIQLCQPPTAQIWFPATSGVTQSKIAVES
jgi:hypothetical protein